MTKLHELAELGQAVWLDYIRRSFITSGELKGLLDQGIRGVTSNPTIFEKAIAGSDDYDDALAELVEQGNSAEEIYDALSIEDIRMAADVLRPVHDATGDGYVSLEVSPELANDTEKTISEARRLWGELKRPNIMIKVPATPAGIPAIETLISDGININVTLIFSLEQYEDVMNAYLSGLEKRLRDGGEINTIASVASFFVSRVDGKVDKLLEEKGNSDLRGKIAIANAKLAYARFKEIFSGERWMMLSTEGARVQRPLWASTSTKDPSYPDTLYVDTLIGADTVNTMPPNTVTATLDHATPAVAIEDGVEEAAAQIERLATLGIDLDAVTDELMTEGVDKFAQSFVSLMSSIREKRDKLVDGWMQMELHLDSYQGKVDKAMAELDEYNIIERIYRNDHTVWKEDPTEISNRLGWLHIADILEDNLHRLHGLTDDVRSEGYTTAVLLGMGGSSLAPEVFQKVFGTAEGYLRLHVLDSTDPGTVLNLRNTVDLSKTLFIVSTKSGGTVETFSFFKYFYNEVANMIGSEEAGRHFVAITDPGSKLVETANEYRFRAVFQNDPNIGGRYSALSYFGLVPAALIGVDVQRLLDRAQTAMRNTESCTTTTENNGAKLGVVMGELALEGRDKVTIIPSRIVEPFGDWVEQLIAESTGKEGKGILPVVGEALGAQGVYSNDRLFVYLDLEGDDFNDDAVNDLIAAGEPVVRINLHDLYDLGAQFFLWEMATAIAGQRLGINPFDQPNVESAKVLARDLVSTYQSEGKLPEPTPAISNGMIVYGETSASTPEDALKQFVEGAQSGAYLSLQAYVVPTAEMDAALNTLRLKLRDSKAVATTVGYGPRFLHSTGQLHKGDGGNGLFIQFAAAMPEDADIPDEAGKPESAMSFGVLKTAQLFGDRQALLDNNRSVLTINLGDNPVEKIKQLTDAL